VQRVGAIREQRGKAFAEIQPAAVELDQERDEVCCRTVFGLCGEVEMCQEILIGQIGQRAEGNGARDGVHPPSIPSSDPAVRLAAWWTIGPAIAFGSQLRDQRSPETV
jgi:hypothetical protein